jgi:hypothetical protein
MFNAANANEELGARLYEILLRVKLSGLLTSDDMKVLCYATGVQVNTGPEPESRLQRLQRMAREAQECELRG